ncbi:MAG: hypothetical protein JO128_00475 [Alphaproteobacteria bacterium]|nr:hypothetical protein [Alphaproteobacteria bacterium]
MTAMGLPHGHRLSRLLAVLCLALGAVIATEIADSPSTAPPTASDTRPRAAKAAPDDASFTLPPVSTFSEVVARPLFSDTRRPSTFAAASPDARPTFVLVGTVLSSQARDALIRHGQPARVDHVAEGQTLDGWTVDSILPDRVIFANAGTRLEVSAKEATTIAAAPEHRRNSSPSNNLTSVPEPPSKE